MIKAFIENHGGARVFEYLDVSRDLLERSIIGLHTDAVEVASEADSDNKSNPVLPENIRLLFVNKLADFTVDTFGYSPTKEQFTQVALGAIELVPQLRSKGESGIVSLIAIELWFNQKYTFKNVQMFFQDLLVSKVHGGSGYLYNRVRYLRKKQSKFQQPLDQPEEEENENIDERKTMAEDFLFLKTTILTKENIDEVKEKLKATVEYRDDLLKDENLDLKEHFPYFFVQPRLVNFSLFYFYIIYCM